MISLPELPSKFQNGFEADKAKAELEYATRAERFPHNPPYADFRLHSPLLIQKVFFAFCSHARAACRADEWTIKQVSQSIEAVWPIICDSYFAREYGASSETDRAAFRVALWRTVSDDPQWKQHLEDLTALAETASVLTSDHPKVGPTGSIVSKAEDGVDPGEKVDNGTASAPLRPAMLSESKSQIQAVTELQPTRSVVGAYTRPQALEWKEVEIAFTSEERIQIRIGTHIETRNFEDMGFGSKKNGLPVLAWATLRILAESEGRIRATGDGQAWRLVEKRIQEIRRVLRSHFRLADDPFEFLRKNRRNASDYGYRAKFKISCRPSYNA